jgi:hypothetical protein
MPTPASILSAVATFHTQWRRPRLPVPEMTGSPNELVLDRTGTVRISSQREWWFRGLSDAVEVIA